MVTHRSLRTLAITRIIVVFFALVMLAYPHSLARAQNRTPQVPTGIPWGTGGASKKSSSVDTDGFKTFDALKTAEKLKLLLANGPRMMNQYQRSDVSLRVVILGRGIISCRYGLQSDAFAELTISIPGKSPLITKIDPAPRGQIEIRMPADFGTKPQVASLSIKARTNRNQPANFKIYELAMEEDRAPDIRKAHAVRSNEDPGPVLPLTSVQITVSPYTTIRVRKKPKMLFSLKSPKSFSGGRWEFWLDDGWSTSRVWDYSTGAISRNKLKLGSWDGTTTNNLDSLGNHSLQLVVWNGKEGNSWTVAQTDLNLIVNP